MGSRRENLGSVLKTVLSWVQPVTWAVLQLSLIGFSFSPSSTRCFTAVAPIPALHTTQWGPEVLSAARSSQADDFGEQQKGGLFPIFPSMLVKCMWAGYWYLTCYAHRVSDTAVALSGTLFVPYINNDTFKRTSTPCRSWLLLVSTSCSCGVGSSYLYHLGPLGRRGEACREHATAVTSQGAS